MEEDVVEVSEGEVLLEDVCGVPEREGRREAVLGVYEHKGGEANGADSLAEKR